MKLNIFSCTLITLIDIRAYFCSLHVFSCWNINIDIWNFLIIILPGPILESMGMRATFQKKGKKGQNIWKFGQKCTKFENILEKGKWLCAIIALIETARKGYVYIYKKNKYLTIYGNHETWLRYSIKRDKIISWNYLWKDLLYKLSNLFQNTIFMYSVS